VFPKKTIKIAAVKSPLFPAVAGLLFSVALAALAANDEEWSARVWQSDSLSDRMQTGLAQTDDGFLWVATSASLVRFDGFSFQEFSSEDLISQPERRLRAMTHGHDDSLVLAFDGGVIARLRNGAVNLFTNVPPQYVPETVLEDAEGALWMTARDIAPTNGNRYVGRIKDGQIKWFADEDGLPAGRYFLARDAGGQIWFARDGDVGVFRNDQFQVITRLPVRQLTRIACGADGGIWLASGLELFRYDRSHGLKDCGMVPVKNSASRPILMLADNKGGLWIATSYDGLFRYDEDTFESILSSHHSIFSLLEDRDGNIWTGTSVGLDRFQPQAIRLEGATAGGSLESVRSVCEDTSETLWAATHDGLLAVRTNGEWKIVTDELNLHGLYVTSLAADPSGSIWIGTGNRKILRRNAGKPESWGPEDGISGRSVVAMCVTRQGDVWAAWNGPNSLQCFHSGAWNPVPLAAGADSILAIAEDAAGDIWFGLANGSLLCARQGSLQVENVPLPGTRAMVLCLHGTEDGSLWIGFKSGGIGRVKNGRFAVIGPEQGFAGNRVLQIQSDGLGNLWFGTDQGIVRVPQAALDRLAEGRAEHVQSSVYASGPELLALSHDAGGALRSRDGRLWIPMGMTLATINPAKLNENVALPCVLLKRVTVDGRDVALYGGNLRAPTAVDLAKSGRPLRLDAGARKLEFEFTALNLRAPENVHFRYRLEGFDEKWIETHDQRNAAYSRLAPGTYRFHVTACNSAGIWNESEAAITVTIAPAVWQRWWFWLLAVAAFVAVIVLAVRAISFHRLRRKLRALEQQAALDQERARIARDIHDDVGGNLTKILLLTELTLRDGSRPDKAEKVPERVREISGTARQVLKSLDETVWAIDPRNDTLPDLITYLSQFAVSFLQSANISCYIDVPDHPASRTLPADVRHNLFLAAKEGLTNVVRHARATTATLQIVADDERLVIVIADNGCGFAGSPTDPGADGLRNMQLRMREVDGDFEVRSVPGSGTQISFIYSWKTSAEK